MAHNTVLNRPSRVLENYGHGVRLRLILNICNRMLVDKICCNEKQLHVKHNEKRRDYFFVICSDLRAFQARS